MSKLEKLIEELCADGVEYKKIKDISQVSIGEFVHKSKQSEESQYPVYNGGISNTGFYEEYNRTANKIIISARGANAGFVNRVFTNYWSGNSCYTIDINVETDWNYVYYYLKSKEQKLLGDQQKGGIPAISKKQVEEFQIPLPPLPVQSEIVSILDNFTELTAELTAELTDRKKQYKYYSTALFDNATKSGTGAIKDVCYIEKGKTPIQKAIPGEYPMVVTTTERKSCNSYQFDTKAVCIPLVSSRGHGVASLNHVYYQEGKFALGNILCALIPKDEAKVFPKYLYYYFEQTKDYTLVPLMKGGANVALHMKDIEKLKIPIPPLSEQQRIVNILDQFDSLCNDISNGLPAEIDERQNQYEYYRDKLLTFRKLM